MEGFQVKVQLLDKRFAQLSQKLEEITTNIKSLNYNYNLSLNISLIDYTSDVGTMILDKQQAKDLYQLNSEILRNKLTIKDLKKHILDKRFNLEFYTQSILQMQEERSLSPLFRFNPRSIE